MKTQMTQSFNQYSENETKIWSQNILNQFNRFSSSCLRSHFVISLRATSHLTISMRGQRAKFKEIITITGIGDRL